MGFDAVFALVVDGSPGQIAFEVLEGFFDFGELDIELPELLGIVAGSKVATQQDVDLAGQSLADGWNTNRQMLNQVASYVKSSLSENT